MKLTKTLFTLSLFLSSAFALGLGKPAELCIGKVEQGLCQGKVHEGGLWGRTDGDFYLRFYLGDKDLWLGLYRQDSGIHVGDAVFDQFSPKERSYTAMVPKVSANWSEIQIQNLPGDAKYYFREQSF